MSKVVQRSVRFESSGAANSESVTPSLGDVLDELRVLHKKVEYLCKEIPAIRGEKDPDRNLPVREAAEIASISERKMRTLIHAGEVPSIKIGRRRLVPNQPFRAWLRRKAEATT
jgi:excisionase family DNA binding protein